MNKVKRFARTQTQSARATAHQSQWHFVLPALLVFVGVGLLLWWRWPAGAGQINAAPVAAPEVGAPAVDFSLPALTGETVRLGDLAGQVVIVNLWATWCPPCKAEMPAIDAYYEAHRGEGLTVLAVNSQDAPTTVQAFINAQGFHFPVLLDQHNVVSDLYQVQGLPTTFVIDRDGVIQHIQIGAISAQQLDAVVRPLL